MDCDSGDSMHWRLEYPRAVFDEMQPHWKNSMFCGYMPRRCALADNSITYRTGNAVRVDRIYAYLRNTFDKYDEHGELNSNRYIIEHIQFSEPVDCEFVMDYYTSRARAYKHSNAKPINDGRGSMMGALYCADRYAYPPAVYGITNKPVVAKLPK